MARCDEGYLCEVCSQPVDPMTESDLYLRFIIGQVPAEKLTAEPERHIRCNPVQAQFIVDDDFEPVVVEGPFSKTELDADYVRQQEDLVTRGWKRLHEVAGSGLPVDKYSLPEFQKET